MSVIGFFGTLWVFGIIVVSIITLMHMVFSHKKIHCDACKQEKWPSRFNDDNVQFYADGYYGHVVRAAVCKSCEPEYEINEEMHLKMNGLLSGVVKKKEPGKGKRLISWTMKEDRIKKNGVIRYVGTRREE